VPNETDSILKILKSKEYSKLIGLEEDIHFEAKGKNPYNLDNPNGRYELAKDVSSFANCDGGIIIIGLIHKRIINKNTEKIEGVDLFCKSEFDTDKYFGIIINNIFPKIKEIEISWINDSKDVNKGIAYIYIPKQDQNKKFFLISNLVEESESIKGIVFGIAQRIDSSSQPLSIDQLHHKIQSGINPNSVMLKRIEDKIDFLSENIIYNGTASPSSKIHERIIEIVKNKE